MKLTVLLFILFQTAVSFAQLRCVDVVLSLDRNQAIQLPSHNPESVDRLTGFWKPKLLKKFEFNLYGQHLQNLIANKPDLVPLSTLEGKMASIEFARRSTMNPENYRNSVIDEIAWLKTNQQKKIIELLKKNDFSNTYFKDFLPEFSAEFL